MSKYIVTGGAGFIGSHLVEKLLKNGSEVVVLDDFSTGFKKYLPNHSKLDIVEVDISNWGELSKKFCYFKNTEGVFHLAAKARIQPSIKSPHETHETNVTGTLNVLELMRASGVKYIVYSASSSSYGHQTNLPFSEKEDQDCQTPYALSKWMGELYCKTWSKLYGFKSVCLKYFNVYGRRSPLQGAYAPVIGLFLKQALQGKPLTIIGDGEQKRDFTHVSDVVRANILALNKLKTNLPVSGETINIGSGVNYSINEVAKLIEDSVSKIKSDIKTISIPERVGETRETLADIDKAEKLLKWKPGVHLVEGINDMLNYYLNDIEEFKKEEPIL